jgi:hypothetical protein
MSDGRHGLTVRPSPSSRSRMQRGPVAAGGPVDGRSLIVADPPAALAGGPAGRMRREARRSAMRLRRGGGSGSVVARCEPCREARRAGRRKRPQESRRLCAGAARRHVERRWLENSSDWGGGDCHRGLERHPHLTRNRRKKRSAKAAVWALDTYVEPSSSINRRKLILQRMGGTWRVSAAPLAATYEHLAAVDDTGQRTPGRSARPPATSRARHRGPLTLPPNYRRPL